MALYVKDTTKLWITTDSNYKQPLFERSDDSLNKRERTDINVCESGHAFLGAGDIAYLAGSGVGANTDIATVLGVYIEASDAVRVNVKTTASSNGISNLRIQGTSTTNAVAYLTCNVAISAGTFDITAINANTSVSWVLYGI